MNLTASVMSLHVVADRKGHSFIGYFFLSLLFFPLALIMAYVVKDRSGVAYT